MKKISSIIVKGKWIIVSVFTILLGISIVGSFFVKINYNISDYLNDDTDTKIAIQIIEDEFGMTGNLQVMLSNIDIDEAKNVSKDLKKIDNVLSVNFDAYSKTSYKDGNALYIILIDGDDYSSTSEQVINDVKELINSKYNYEALYGGTSIEKQELKNGLTNEIKYILIVALALIVIILLITSKSWLEPILLLAVSGVAIIINSGSNFFFGEISYITNSIAAILQLALSIDYSIVLIHSYRKSQNSGLSNDEAIKGAIIECVKPISASGLTTIAGLVALLFMSFTIGFDIGIVLIKGILISVITSVTLLPCVLLIMDKLLVKTRKKKINLKGKSFAKISFNASKIIVPLSVVIILIALFAHGNMNYTFADTKILNEKMVENFGENNSVVVVFKNDDNSYERQQYFINKIQDYKKNNGEEVLIDYTSYINTVREVYSTKKANQKLELSNNEAKQLFEMYHLYNNPESLKLDFNTFIDYAYYLVLNDSEVIEMIDEETKNMIIQLKVINDLLLNENTANEFYLKLQEGTDIESIKYLYGIHEYELLEDKTVNFEAMLDFIILVSNINSSVGEMIGNDINSIISLNEGVKAFIAKMDLMLNKEEFKNMIYQDFEISFTEEEVNQIYNSYFLMNSLEETEKVEYLNLLNHLIVSNIIEDATFIQTINNYSMLYNTIKSKYEYNQFIDVLKNVCYCLTSEVPTININNESIFQIYIMYFNSLGCFDNLKISGIDFVNFALQQYEINPIINSQITQEDYNKLKDMSLVYSLSSDVNKHNYQEITQKLTNLQQNMTSVDASLISDDKVSGIYIKYSIDYNLNNEDGIMAFELLDFINENKNTNYLLNKKLTEDKIDKLNEANEDLDKAEKLFSSDNYSRMILSLDIKNDSDEGNKFVDYIKTVSKEVFGDDTYIAGELMSTYDLKESFEYDNILISIITIISILIIVLVAFKSLSLPCILVVIIQGSIWITCSILVLFKTEIFFMSYIVASCILMGATIDYGILMSNSYIEYRKDYDKKESLVMAIDKALPTIFTSGLILTICGFVIGFISSQVSIATVGKLIGLGTISSIIMILFVLPSALYLLDKFVLKLTMHKNKNE